MFFQPPGKEPPTPSYSCKPSTSKSTSTLKKRKKQKNKKKEVNQVNHSLGSTMSAWAQNFTMAATWQLKHEVAMWKSRAIAFQYENQILRDTLRQFYVSAGMHSNVINPSLKRNNANPQYTDYEGSYMDCEQSGACSEEVDAESDNQVEDGESEYELEISEEYMAFLRQNFEYRKARDERKKREAEEEKRIENAEIAEPQPAVDRTEEFKELYGASWKRIAALDTYLTSEYMSLCDSEKPGFWPNIPLRF